MVGNWVLHGILIVLPVFLLTAKHFERKLGNPRKFEQKRNVRDNYKRMREEPDIFDLFVK